MPRGGSTPRRLSRERVVVCALLDAFALRMDLGAAAGRFALVRTPLAIGARGLSWVIRFWSTTWVGAFLGVGWVIRTFQQGKRPLR